LIFDIFSDEREIPGLLRIEQVCKDIVFAALEHLVADLRIIEKDLVSVKFEIGDFILLMDRGHFLKSLSV
jgi:hypothetical protein